MLALSATIIRRAAPPLGDRRTTEALRAALRAARLRGRREITVVWTGDAEIRRLNRRYRGCDRTTDVLSFPSGARRGLPDADALGDILISVPEARREAARAGRDPADEALLLVVHGALHLLGHDHARPAERRRMFRLQNAILRTLGAGPAALLPVR